MLTARITIPPPPNPESEDIFSSALGVLFTDDTINSHGTPGSSIIYRSPHFGDICLHVPAHPDAEDGRKLFAHYLWNAGVIAAEAIESASLFSSQDMDHPTESDPDALVQWNTKYWNVKDKHILELGAGTALPSLISALCGASTCTITDHPSSPALITCAIDMNVHENLFSNPQPTTKSTILNGDGEACRTVSPQINVYGYTWGSTTMYETNKYGKPARQQPGSFDRIIIADCLWMPSQHANLVETILRYLSSSDLESCALVVAGFHTGRGTVRDFFETATREREEKTRQTTGEEQSQEMEAVSGLLRIAEIFEIDVDGTKRSWEPRREGENKEQAKRWCVCAALVRR